MTRVAVFGVFDGLHPGHLAFLKQAHELGEELIVLVARDESVNELKHRSPRKNLQARINDLQQIPEVTAVLSGDTELGSYHCLKAAKPTLIAFGYDQTDLMVDFKRFQQATGDETPITVLKPYQEKLYKSSLLNT